MLRKIAIVYLMALIFFVWGVAAVKYDIFPGGLINSISQDIELFQKGDDEGSKLSIETAVGSHFSDIPLKHLREKDFQAESALKSTVSMGEFPSTVAESCLKLTTSYNNAIAVLLVGDGATVLHQWDVNYDRVFDTEGQDKEGDVDSALLMPDGSVVVNYSPYRGLARIKADGEIMWKISDLQLHHSITLTENDTLWVPGREVLQKNRFGQLAGRQEDLFFEIDSESGRVIRKIYTVDILAKNSLHGLYEWIISQDKLHINDIQEVGQEFAEANSQLNIKATDLIAVAKRMNLVFIVDPDSLLVKWFAHYPWNQPHDADPLVDGSFLLFDNNQSKGRPVRRWGTSRILKIYPNSEKRYEIVFSEDWFHSDTRSRQQQYNSNLLVTVDNPAYVFNVVDGSVNYWYVNEYDKGKNWYVEDAEWIDANYFSDPELVKLCDKHS